MTPKPVGILTADDSYAAIIPKSTFYPTPEPFRQTFRTVRDSQRAVIIPVFHALVDEFDRHNIEQRIGYANIYLGNNFLPTHTPVSISMSIDADGCLAIESSIQYGSERCQQVAFDLNAPVASAGRRCPVCGAEVQQEDERCQQCRHALEEEPTWVLNLRWSIVSAEIALEEYYWLLTDPAVISLLRGLITEGNEALVAKNNFSCTRVEVAIDGGAQTSPGALLRAHSRRDAPTGDGARTGAARAFTGIDYRTAAHHSRRIARSVTDRGLDSGTQRLIIGHAKPFPR